MRLRRVLSGFVVGLLGSAAVVARANDVQPKDAQANNAPAIVATNIEDAPTPLSLARLLPEDGADAVDIRYWLIWGEKYDGSASGTVGYRYVSIRGEGGKLAVQVVTFSRDETDDAGRLRLVYDKSGRLESYDQSWKTSSGRYSGVRGSVRGGFLRLTDQDPIPIESLEDRVVFECLPLVFAYHIRHGHLGYRFQTREMSWLEHPAPQVDYQTSLEDLGVESVDFDGQSHDAHVLRLKYRSRYRGSNEVYRCTGQVLTLPNGEVMRWSVDYDEMTYRARRATVDEVAERFGIKPKRLRDRPNEPLDPTKPEDWSVWPLTRNR